MKSSSFLKILFSSLQRQSPSSPFLVKHLHFAVLNRTCCFFLNDSIRELEKLSTTGILFSGLRFLAKPLVLTTDTQARPVFLNCIIFSGECGCNFCLHTGKTFIESCGFKGLSIFHIFISPIRRIDGSRTRSRKNVS